LSTKTNNQQNRQQCYHCGTELEPGTRICPVCGRKQTRTCYCGAEIPVTARTCPECGADWSASRRVRRKSKSRKIDWKQLAKFAALGALISLLAAAALNATITALAQRSLANGQSLPASLSQRLALALSTIYTAMATLANRIAEYSAGVATLMGILALGAGAGAVAYLIREGFWSRWRRRSARKVKRRRSSSATNKAE